MPQIQMVGGFKLLMRYYIKAFFTVPDAILISTNISYCIKAIFVKETTPAIKHSHNFLTPSMLEIFVYLIPVI